ncbi:MAG: glycosyltransferase [Candidatus Aminicenantes bacterium]|nr:MAG: glycosyltransferase [Candidatus Aminicenantes bacterium]
MKVLLVSSGNSKEGISIIVKNQAESLRENGVQIEYFAIVDKGIKGYLKNIPRLRKFLKSNRFDIIHAHYSLSGVVALLAGARPLVVSLMGSDIEANLFLKLIFKIFRKFLEKNLIVKSESIKEKIKSDDAHVIPNGVDLKKFSLMDQRTAREQVGFNQDLKYIIFVANPARYEKNHKLAQKAYQLLNDNNVILEVVHNVAHRLIPFYMNAADVVLLTSLWEGSPNVIKEAMACNCPVVSTDVGDVREIIGETEGCYITTFEPEDVAEKLKIALVFGKRTDGREHIRYLDSNVIAKKIIKLYEKIFEGNR